MIRYIFNLLLIVGGLGTINAQDSLSLEQAIVIGLQNNFDIQISDKQVEIAQNNNSWGSAGAYPTVSLSAYGTINHTNSIPSTVTEINTMQTVPVQPSVDLSWVVFNGLRIRTTKAQLADLHAQSAGNAAIVVENTLQSIIMAYYLAKLNDEALKVTEEVLELTRDRYNYVLSKKEYGSAVTFDVLQAKNNYLSDSANALSQRINLQNSLRNLNLVLAEPVEKDYALSSNYEMDESDKDFQLADLVAKMESSNKTLQNQYVYQEILKKNTQLSKSALYPAVSLSLGANLNTTGVYYEMENGSWTDSYGLSGGLALSWILSDGGNVRSAIENAKINEEIGELQTEQMRRSMNNQLFRSFEEYNLKRQLRGVSLVNVESAKLNLQIAEDKFKSGAINSFNYRDIQVVYLNAANQLLQANYNLVTSYTELLRLTGGIVTEYGVEE